MIGSLMFGVFLMFAYSTSRRWSNWLARWIENGCRMDLERKHEK